jgi:hypothetical protein
MYDINKYIMANVCEKKLHVILDIDETLVYFIKKCFLPHSWDKHLKEVEEKAIEGEEAAREAETKKYDIHHDKKNGLLFIRPHIRCFLKWLFTNCHVYLWTWSDEEYARDMSELLIGLVNEKYPGTYKFERLFAEEVAEAAGCIEGNSKDLNYLWYDLKVPGMHEYNTILIDDLPNNTINSSNIGNSITVNPFALFGEVKKRTDPYTDVSGDKTLLDVIEILKKTKEIVEKNCNDKYVNIFPFINKKTGEVDYGGCQTKHFIKNLKKVKRCKQNTIINAIGAGKSIHFIDSQVQNGGRLFYKTQQKMKNKNIYVNTQGDKYIMKGGSLVKKN